MGFHKQSGHYTQEQAEVQHEIYGVGGDDFPGFSTNSPESTALILLTLLPEGRSHHEYRKDILVNFLVRVAERHGCIVEQCTGGEG